MPELRQNFFTKEWVIIATERSKRPEEMATHRAAQPVPAFLESCPFCPGNESKTPSEVLRFPANGEPWLVRVIPNKFAALSSDIQPKRSLQHLRAAVLTASDFTKSSSTVRTIRAAWRCCRMNMWPVSCACINSGTRC